MLSMKTLHFHTMDFIQNRLRFLAGVKFAYIKLNMPTPCPPRSAVPVNHPFLTAGAGAGLIFGVEFGKAFDSSNIVGSNYILRLVRLASHNFLRITDTHIEYDYLGEGELKALGYGAYGDDLATRSFDYLVTNGWTRLKARVTPEGKIPKSWTYTFTGLPKTMTDGRGVVTTYDWNEAKSQLQQKTVDGTPAGLEAVTVDYGYDGLDRLTNIVKTVSGLGEIWQEGYTYDDRSRIDIVTTKVQNIPGQTSALEYSIDYGYNSRGFMDSREVTVGTTTVSTDYQYASDSAKLIQVSDDYATVDYGYDQYGRLRAQTNLINGASASRTVKTWGYDDYSKLSSLSISNSTSLLWGRTYGYNVERITSITNAIDGSYWQYGYDYQGQLRAADLFSSSNTIEHVERYKYDAVGNITHKGIAGAEADVRMTANADDETVQYARHKTATLIGTVGSTNATLSLPIAGTEVVQDGSGNWVAPLVPLYPIPDDSGGMTPPSSPPTNSNIRIQLKAEVSGQTNTYKLAEFRVNPTSTDLGYDANGALLELPADGSNSVPSELAWNAEGRLASVSTNSVEVEGYYYDDQNRRIAKIEDGALVLFLWDSMDNFGVSDSSENITEYYTRGIGIAGDVGTLVAGHDFGGSSTKLLHSNHRGDVLLSSDSVGTAVHEAEYTPYGNVLESSGSYVPRFGFSSKERNSIELVYYGYRYYSSQLNQWLSPDPIGEDGGVNLYRFCENNPINSLDPFGYDNINLTCPGTRSHSVVDHRGVNNQEYTVGGHGFPDGSGPADQRSGRNYPITAEELAKEIKADPNYDPSKPVRLNICYTGKKDFAEDLANELKNIVIAPKGQLAVAAWPPCGGKDGKTVTAILVEVAWWKKFKNK